MLSALLSIAAGIVSQEGVGQPQIGQILTVVPLGILGGEVFGVPVFVSGILVAAPVGIESAEGFGTPEFLAVLITIPSFENTRTGVSIPTASGSSISAGSVAVSARSDNMRSEAR
jgi:hypothetical protein